MYGPDGGVLATGKKYIRIQICSRLVQGWQTMVEGDGFGGKSASPNTHQPNQVSLRGNTTGLKVQGLAGRSPHSRERTSSPQRGIRGSSPKLVTWVFSRTSTPNTVRRTGLEA